VETIIKKKGYLNSKINNETDFPSKSLFRVWPCTGWALTVTHLISDSFFYTFDPFLLLTEKPFNPTQWHPFLLKYCHQFISHMDFFSGWQWHCHETWNSVKTWLRPPPSGAGSRQAGKSNPIHLLQPKPKEPAQPLSLSLSLSFFLSRPSRATGKGAPATISAEQDGGAQEVHGTGHSLFKPIWAVHAFNTLSFTLFLFFISLFALALAYVSQCCRQQ